MSQGKLYSPNYPTPYGDNRNCLLTFNFDTTEFPPGIRKWVILEVQAFDLEDSYDYFRVVDQHGQHSYTGSMGTTYRCMSNLLYDTLPVVVFVGNTFIIYSILGKGYVTDIHVPSNIYCIYTAEQ